MSRYIDADHAEFRLQCCGTYHGVIAFDTVKAVLNDAPSIDLDTGVWCEDCKEYDKEHHNCPRFNRVIRTALEDADMVRVVRCKECKWREKNHYCVKWGQPYLCNDDCFCSYGERREP